MKYKLAAFALAAACAVASGAMAAKPVVGKLQSPVSATSKPIAGGTIFVCVNDTCAAPSPTDRAGNVSTCKALAKQVGAFVSFGAQGEPLDSAKLAECNAAAK